MSYQKKTSALILFVVFLFVSLSGLQCFYKQLVVRRVPILMYRGIENQTNGAWSVFTGDFEKQLLFLKEQGYESILPADLAANRNWGTSLPSKPIILTFDDGYMSIMQNAEPLMKKYGFRGIVYLVTGNISDSSRERKILEGKPLLTWTEVREMHKRGTFTFGGHTRTHASLAAVSNAYPEVISCYQDIKIKGGFKPAGFSYPDGKYRPETISAVINAGFTTAVTSRGDLARTDQSLSLFELPRLMICGGSQVYHVLAEPVTNETSAITVKVRKDKPETLVFPRLFIKGMGPDDGWLEPAKISEDPIVLSWYFPRENFNQPLSIEFWNESRTLPYWRQPLTITLPAAKTDKESR